MASLFNLFPRVVFFTALLIFFAVGSSAQSKADVELKIELPSESARGGESFSYTTTVRNIGSATAIDVVLLNDPTGRVEFKSGIPTRGKCELDTAPRSRLMRCRMGDLDPGESVTISFEMKIGDSDYAEAGNLQYRSPSSAEINSVTAATVDSRSTIASISVHPAEPDPARDNNYAFVKAELLPSRNRAPIVKVLSPRNDAKLTRRATTRTDFTVTIQASDPDGTIDRVVVREQRYGPIPYIGNDGHGFMYLGKKYNGKELDDLLKMNPPPERRAKVTGTDTFAYTLTDPDYGRNQIWVEAYDTLGRSQIASLEVWVEGDAKVEIINPIRKQIVTPGSTLVVETLTKLNEGTLKEINLVGFSRGGSFIQESRPMQLVSKQGNVYRHRYVWKDVPAGNGYATLDAFIVEDSGATTPAEAVSFLVRHRPKFHLSTGPVKTDGRLRSISIQFGLEHSLRDEQFTIFIDGKRENTSLTGPGYVWLYPTAGVHTIQVVALVDDVEVSRSDVLTVKVD